jgi:hypothetical protein
MPSPSAYKVDVTAGPKYDTHTAVAVNTSSPLTIDTSLGSVQLLVHIKDFRAASSSSSPPNEAYFSHDSRTSARFSLTFILIPNEDLSGDRLLLGNDFDQPIRELLPPFFGTALQVVKRVVDPGIDGDPYGEKPYLYGPLLSSANVMRIGNVDSKRHFEQDIIQEDAEGDGKEVREKLGIPSSPGARQKWFLDESRRKEFVFEKGRKYEFDFFNGYLDFNGKTNMNKQIAILTLNVDFALKLPMGISFNVLQWIDDYKIPPLR